MGVDGVWLGRNLEVEGSSPSSRGGFTIRTLTYGHGDDKNRLEYRDGAAFTTPFDDWQELVVTGDGTSRGLELFVQHRTDRLTTWLGYTLAKTDRQFDALNDGALLVNFAGHGSAGNMQFIFALQFPDWGYLGQVDNGRRLPLVLGLYGYQSEMECMSNITRV